MAAEFKYKLDFYYQQALIYLVTLIVYAGIRGTFVEHEFKLIFHDPLLYIIIFFVGLAFLTLALNRIRNRRLVITPTEIIFQHRFDRRVIPIADIEWMHVGRERGVQTAGRSQVIIFKIKGRQRAYRIRVGRYEKDRELIAEMMRIAANVPRRQKRRFTVQRRYPDL